MIKRLFGVALFAFYIFPACRTKPVFTQDLDQIRGSIAQYLDPAKQAEPNGDIIDQKTESTIQSGQLTEKEAAQIEQSILEIWPPESDSFLEFETAQEPNAIVKRAVDSPVLATQPSQNTVLAQQTSQSSAPSPASAAVVGSASTAPAVTTSAEVSAQPAAGGIAGVLATAANAGLDSTDQFAVVADRLSQRMKARLNRLQNSVDTMVDSKLNAYNDLFRSVVSTGVKFPTTAMRLAFATVRVPLDVIG